MIRVGITGGIGSGKSTVSKIFSVLGIPVYSADEAAKNLMNEDAALKQQIMDTFGKDVYSGGILNRKALAGIVFHDPAQLQQLNALVHPATIRHAEEWMQQQQTPYAIKEAAILFESGAQELLDYVIGVYAPTSLRIQRTMHRDGITREEVQARMSKQIDEHIKMMLCDFVITNDEQQLLIPQVMALHEKLLALTPRSSS